MQESNEQISQANPAIAAAAAAQSDEVVSLVDAARNGDSTALSAIYERYCDRIYHYALFKLGNSQQAEDICAQVFLKMMESVGRFEWRSGGSNSHPINSASFSSWLYRIAQNLITDQMRREARRPAVPLDSVASYLPGSSDPAHAAEETMFREQLALALEGLTDLQAQVIALKFGSGLSNAEVGQLLSRSEGAVKALQYSALQKLQRLLGPALEALPTKNYG